VVGVPVVGVLSGTILCNSSSGVLIDSEQNESGLEMVTKQEL